MGSHAAKLALVVCLPGYVHPFSTVGLFGPVRRCRAPQSELCALPKHLQPINDELSDASEAGPRKISSRLNMVASAAIDTPKESQASKKKEKKKKKARKRETADTGAAAMRQAMADHELLTREQDFEFGEKIHKAREVRNAMRAMIDLKSQELMEAPLHPEMDEPIDESLLLAAPSQREDGGLDWDELNSLSVFSPSLADFNYEQNSESFGWDLSSDDNDDGYDIKSFESDHRANQFQIFGDAGRDQDDDSLLTENDIIFGLNIPGGREELHQILTEGRMARYELIRCNIRLVVSIAKKWTLRSAGMVNSENGPSKTSIYAGSSSRPSLDEVIQEGIVGLANAADRYDSSKKLRFSTYATWWVTNSVRIAFQRAKTGTVNVPPAYHDMLGRYKKALKGYYQRCEKVPSEEDLAIEIGLSPLRLSRALRYTRPLLSLDAPVRMSEGIIAGSGAGGDNVGSHDVMLGDTLHSEERSPTEYVELAMLRQCLENAMSSELSPHERDVVRLRLGLDDGVMRSFKEICDVCGDGVSMSEIQTSERRAFEKMRSHSVHSKQLASFLDPDEITLKSGPAAKKKRSRNRKKRSEEENQER